MQRSHFTPKTHWIGAASLVALVVSLWSQSWVLLMLAFAGLAMVASARFSLSKSLGPSSRRLATDTVTEGESLPVTVRVEGPRRGSALVELRDRLMPGVRLGAGTNYRVLLLRRQAKQSFQYEAVSGRLGVFQAGPLEARREDPFGLRTRVDVVAPAAEYLVRPRAEELRRSPERSELPRVILGRHDVSQPGDGFDFFGLRDYMPGDRMRSVNWKASARSPRMVVNQFERESHAEIVIFVDARAVTESGLETDTPYAQGARAAASLVRRYLRARDRVRVIVYGESVRELGGQGRATRVEDVLDGLARVQPAGDNPVLIAVEEQLPKIRGRSPVVIVSPLFGDPTLEDAVTTLGGHGAQVTILVPVPLPADPHGQAWSLRLLEQRMAVESLRSLGAVVLEILPSEPLSPQIRKVH